MPGWSLMAPAVGAAFAASAVEAVEALTIVLAVGVLRGWRAPALGAGAGVAVLAALVLALGPLLGHLPLPPLQFGIGLLLLLFGLGWLRKAALRAAGVIPLHDEAAIFAAETRRLGGQAASGRRQADWLAGMTAFKAVLLEGLEIVFIVIAVGAARGMLVPAALAAAAACALVLAAGLAVHRPLTRVPENTLKFAVGVMLASFGVFWLGEGLGVPWPGEDLILLPFMALFLAAGLGAAALARRAVAAAAT